MGNRLEIARSTIAWSILRFVSQASSFNCNRLIANSYRELGNTMNTMESLPLVFPHLLADRAGNFAALRLDFGPVQPDESLSPLLELPDLVALAASVPCLFVDDGFTQLPPTLAGALSLSGCKTTDADCIYRVDRTLESHYPTDIKWIDGDWYLQPPSKPTSAQAASRSLALQLVQLVSADADTHELEAIFRRDPTLSYHLLRLVNSLAVGVGRRITSFSQAIVILGRQQLRRWLNLMLFSARDGDQRSAMLLARVAVRARLMELLARTCGMDKSLQDQAFMSGMFSMLGTLFGLPIEEVMRPLAVSDAIRGAVLARDGDIGNLINTVELAERGIFAELADSLDAMQIAREDFNLSAIQACAWMLGVVRDSQGRSDA